MLNESTGSGGFNSSSGDDVSMQSSSGSGMLHLRGGVDLGASYHVSDSGTLRTHGFVIKQSGLAASPASAVSPASASPSPASASSAPPSIDPRDLLDLGSVGKGACGVVRRALHLPTLRLVAVKSINVFDDSKRRQMVKELTALSGMQSPYIVSLLAAWHESGCVKLALDYSNRNSLLEALRTYGAMDERMLQRVALHACRGLDTLHRAHVVHRDLKPGNLLIDSGANVRLTDFGLVRLLEGTSGFAATAVGTQLYFAPERVADDARYSYASDIWAMGLSLLYLATGDMPYKDAARSGYIGIMKAIRDELPPPLPASNPAGHPFSARFRDFLSHMLQKDPTRRASAQQLLTHPFLQRADEEWTAHVASAPGGIVHPLMSASPADAADLDLILQVIYQACYAQNKDVYRKSLLERARWQRLAEQLAVPQIGAMEVQQRWEQLYAQWKQQGL